jgi:hypothetical protein
MTYRFLFRNEEKQIEFIDKIFGKIGHIFILCIYL